MNRLYLASASPMRRRLLAEAGWPFEVVEHTADEKSCAWDLSLEEMTVQLARLKMAHVVLPGGHEHNCCFIITADTLCQDSAGVICGKPAHRAGAIAMVKRVRKGVVVGTGFCIERRVRQNDTWIMQERIVGYAHAWCSLAIADDEIEKYFEQLKKYSGFEYLKLAGAFSVTGYGAQFLGEVRGSYSAILGLPMAQVREGLKSVGYFEGL